MDNKELVEICMRMISYTGEGRSHVFEAKKSLRKGDINLTKELFVKAEALFNEAHKIQFQEIMAPQQKGTEIPFNVLLLHAMDLLMVSTSEFDILRLEMEEFEDEN